MDDPALDKSEHERALAGLARVHALTRTASRFWKPIEQLLDQQRLTRVSILDVGCGDGFVLRSLYHQARRRGVELQLTGCDFSPQALDFARKAAARQSVPVDWHCLDITQSPLPCRADVVLCSLFLHHFTHPQVISILRKLSSQAVHLVQVDDLLRSRLGYYLCLLGVHVLSRSPVVHTDGPLSVRAAFTKAEMRNLLDSAGMRSATLQRRWPERLLVQYRPASAESVGGIRAERN